MTTARDIMNPGAECIGENETLRTAASRMADLGVGALPICSAEKRLVGMLTDRDIVVKCLANGGDPDSATAGEFRQDEAVTIGADDDVAEVLRTMADHAVRRLPVIDGHDLVGMVALADVATSVPDPQVGKVLSAISTT
ncbi:MAG: CBS domain-containing protein [Jatrophihabitantaceae bacterium]